MNYFCDDRKCTIYNVKNKTIWQDYWILFSNCSLLEVCVTLVFYIKQLVKCTVADAPNCGRCPQFYDFLEKFNFFPCLISAIILKTRKSVEWLATARSILFTCITCFGYHDCQKKLIQQLIIHLRSMIFPLKIYKTKMTMSDIDLVPFDETSSILLAF